MTGHAVVFRRTGEVTVDGRVVGTWTHYAIPQRPFREFRFENLGGRVFTSDTRYGLRPAAIAAFNTQEG